MCFYGNPSAREWRMCNYSMKSFYVLFLKINYLFFVVIYVTNKHHRSVGFRKTEIPVT